MVGNRQFQRDRLVGRDCPVHQFSSLHVAPFKVRAMTCINILGAPASWLAANFITFEERPGAHEFNADDITPDLFDARKRLFDDCVRFWRHKN